jgi:hypothetical protein
MSRNNDDRLVMALEILQRLAKVRLDELESKAERVKEDARNELGLLKFDALEVLREIERISYLVAR